MLRFLSFLFSILFIFIVTGQRGQTSTAELVKKAPSALSSVESCPYQTPEEWQQFLEMYASNKKWVDTCEDSRCDPDFYYYVKNNIQKVFEVCARFIAENPSIDRCTYNMRRFVPAWLPMHDADSYGFLVDNRTYFAEQDAPDKPEGMMKVPDVIAAALPDRSRVEEAARLNGMKFLTHDSALSGIRTFVIYSDPAGRFDQWLLLNLQAGKSSITQNTPLSVLTVQKKTGSGVPLAKVRIHFRDYAITPVRDGVKLELNESGNGKCYSCHTHGVRQLIARRTPVLSSQPSRGEVGFDESGKTSPPDFAFSRLMELNRVIRAYGPTDWDGKVIPDDHGPVLGRAQGCIDCHDGQSRAALNASTSPTQVAQKIFHEMSMPPDTHLPRWIERKEMQNPKLSSDEVQILQGAFDVHQDLDRKFNESRYPELKNWFLEVRCR